MQTYSRGRLVWINPPTLFLSASISVYTKTGEGQMCIHKCVGLLSRQTNGLDFLSTREKPIGTRAKYVSLLTDRRLVTFYRQPILTGSVDKTITGTPYPFYCIWTAGGWLEDLELDKKLRFIADQKTPYTANTDKTFCCSLYYVGALFIVSYLKAMY